MRITENNIITELRFSGSTRDIREIIERLQSEPRGGRQELRDLKEAAREFLTNAFGKAEDLDDTQYSFTQLDIADILDDFTDFAMGITWNELKEKDKKRRIARIAQKPQRRELY